MKVAITSIRVDGGTQARAELNADTVADYSEALKAGEIFPAVTVVYDGTNYWLADGFHRVAAHQMAGASEVDVNVKTGDQRAAVLLAVGANASHGLRRTNADKRRAIELLLSDEEWSKNSDNWIADAAHVSNKTVTAVRADLGIPKSITVQSKDGRQRPARRSTAATVTVPDVDEATAAPDLEPAVTSVQNIQSAADVTPTAAKLTETPRGIVAEGLSAEQWAALRPALWALLRLLPDSSHGKALRGRGKTAKAFQAVRDLFNEIDLASRKAGS